MQLREDCEDITGIGDIGWVGRWSHDDEVVPKSIVAGRGCDALIKGYLLCDLAVCDAYVDYAGLEIVDSESCIARIPGDLERR